MCLRERENPRHICVSGPLLRPQPPPPVAWHFLPPALLHGRALLACSTPRHTHRTSHTTSHTSHIAPPSLRVLLPASLPPSTAAATPPSMSWRWVLLCALLLWTFVVLLSSTALSAAWVACRTCQGTSVALQHRSSISKSVVVSLYYRRWRCTWATQSASSDRRTTAAARPTR
jgi:hypothetical protein